MIRVLLVDDQDDARVILADRLRRSHEIELVAAVRDDQEAARALTKTRPDVLLVNLHSRHDGDDVQLCSELSEMVSAPLVVLASFMSRERWQRLHAAGVTRCLLKRVDSEHLARELVRAGSTHGSGSAACSEEEGEAP